MGIAVWALLLYILIIISWVAVLKRNIGEAMIVGFIVMALFGGKDALSLMWAGLVFGATHEVLFAAMAFVFMAYLIEKTGLIQKLINILNSVLGRVRGGAGYVDTIASALFGLISGSGSGNTATVGAITIPWMLKSNWRKEDAATVVAGNAGMGISFPPNGTMFILLGAASVSALVTESQLYIALLIAGVYTLIYRLLVVAWFVRIHKIEALPKEDILPFKSSIGKGWPSLIIFLGILIPVVLTIGPISETLETVAGIGAEGIGSISILVWVPILIIIISLLSAWKEIPKKPKEWFSYVEGALPAFSVIGVILLFAFSASEILKQLGLGEQLGIIMNSLTLPVWLVALLVGLLIVLVATPLTATATVTAIGAVAFESLAGVGIEPVIAAVAILVFASTEGASPPGAAPIFIASGIARVNPVKTFKPLVFLYVIPITLIGWLILMGILPIPIL
ncbi:TRAP transporter large permease subunit [Virgibacillus sp. C22-A2]|uniref:TRAP transporter large permease subunit n=1 Tax=Virgibacillus tibetensis TaxID=3042313 RepID=A0ABU6KE27_9BACI|nr:TRAP transporter large permease subunit [Virgibacillus sp. C22-A2]